MLLGSQAGVEKNKRRVQLPEADAEGGADVGEGGNDADVEKKEDDIDAANTTISSGTRPSGVSSGSMRASSSVAQEAFASQVRRGKLAARKLRIRVTSLLVLMFLVIYSCSQILGHLCAWRVLDSSTPFFLSGAVAVYGMLLVVLPTDVLIIRGCTLAALFDFIVIAAERALYAWWILQGNCPRMYQDEPVACLAAAAISAVRCGVWLLAAIGISTTLRTHRRRFTMPPRRALCRLWNVARLAIMTIGLSEGVIYVIVWAVIPSPMRWLDAVGGVLMSASFIIVSALVTKANRERTLTWIQSVVVADEVRAASLIASLTSNLQIPLLVQHAVAHFRAVRFSSLCEMDFATNVCHRDLSRLSTSSKLGQVDIFLSHSWHDPAATKWSALSRWAQKFHEANGEDPTVWLDKACIDQQNIDESLSCLPIYLAACKKLLVLAGPTYSFRLWCIMEIFTFLQMGGDWRNIEIYPLGADEHCSGEEAKLDFLRQFAEFDALKAQCFKDSDREHFLGIIEGAFGSTASFNLQVQTLFQKRLRRLSLINEPEFDESTGQ
eukprot:TRINITY_DN19844_c0_g1_i2.p1 TRINITY_DN19844_c0_g1~~TRINITY_DN19844_c0_g1_i2.p1  ORF type:complete len:551 (-),score=78.50 TRINITY_DN19844_c0_g1_i2:270-1922(-)